MCKPDSDKFHGTEGDPDPLYYLRDSVGGQKLINEVQQRPNLDKYTSNKITVDDVIGITRDPNGNEGGDGIVWLEVGHPQVGEAKGDGFLHVLEHAWHFKSLNKFTEAELPDVIFTAIKTGEILYDENNGKGYRFAYKYNYNCQTCYILISIGFNGYIVGANPIPEKTALRKLQQLKAKANKQEE